MNNGDTSSRQTRWLVLDVRLARDGVNSGISRFIVGFAQALTKKIFEGKLRNAQGSDTKLLLVSKYEPAPWIVELVQAYPNSVSFWSGGKGALSARPDKPVYYWPSAAFERVRKMTGEDLVWISPGNFDRPMFSSRLATKNGKHRIVQIVHDTIAFEYRKSVGFLFGMQFRFRVKHALTRFPVFTVSHHSADLLKKLVKGKEVDIPVLGEGIDEIFGAHPRPTDPREHQFQRREFLSRAGLLVPGGDGVFERELSTRRWVIGVGRGQPYKNWDLAERAVLACRAKTHDNVLFVRVAPDAASMQQYASRPGAQQLGSTVYLPEQALLAVTSLSDELLAQLYRVSDALVHPSSAEGFGLPPLEAALSGLPVLFRRGTAVDDHFPPGALPEFFWHSVAGENEGEWALALAHMLSEKGPAAETFRSEMRAASSPRAFIATCAGGRRFDWSESAERFLAAVSAHGATSGSH